jgi:AraC family transcriptional regulator, positive regulator of tynA and feaB
MTETTVDEGGQHWVFDTREGPEVFSELAEVMAAVMIPFEATQGNRHVPARRARLGRISLGPLSLVSCDIPDIFSGSAGQISRQASGDRIAVALVTSGSQRIQHGAGCAQVGSGDVFVFDGDEISRIDIPRKVSAQVIIVPRTRVVGTDRDVSGPLDKRRPATRLLRRHLATLGECAALMASTERDLVSTATADLLRLALDERCDVERHRHRSLRISLLPTVLAYVERHLDDYDLDVSQIAAEFSISKRSVHAVFEEAGESPGAYIRRRRLERIWHDMSDHPQIPIAVLGARWGYPNASALTRAFKKEFGRPPREQKTVANEVQGDSSSVRRNANGGTQLVTDHP